MTEIQPIREFVKANFGETYDKLTDTADFDGTANRPDAVGLKIDAALARYSVTEDDLDAFGRSYLADYVTLTLIPLAIDYYMVQTRLVDNASRPPGVTPLGGEVGQNYNRIDALREMAALLTARLTADAPAVSGQIPGLGRTGIQNSNTALPRTIDPLTFPPGGAPGWAGRKGPTFYVVDEEVIVA